MRIGIATPLLTPQIRATAVLSKTQRAYSECEKGGNRANGFDIIFPDDSFSDRNPSSGVYFANSGWTLRSTRSLKTVATGGVRHSLAERLYSSCREVTRTPGGFFRTTRGTLGSVLSPAPHRSGHSACANRRNCSHHLKSGFPKGIETSRSGPTT